MKNIIKLIVVFFIINLNIQNFAYTMDKTENEPTFELKQIIGEQLITAVTSRNPQEIDKILNEAASRNYISGPHAKKALAIAVSEDYPEIIQILAKNKTIQKLVSQSKEEDNADYPFDIGKEYDDEGEDEDCHLGDND